MPPLKIFGMICLTVGPISAESVPATPMSTASGIVIGTGEIFKEKGPDAAVIDDFIAAAGVSRGTFYNHFRTTSELLYALATAMSDEVLRSVDPLVTRLDDPVQRLSSGTRLYMQMALRYPLLGSFITRVGTRIAARGQLIDVYLTRDLDRALQSKTLNVDSVRVARDIVLGSIFYGIETMLTEPTRDHHPEHLMRCVLVGLGVAPAHAQTIAFMPLPDLPATLDGPIFSALALGAGEGVNKAANPGRTGEP